jgi:hypothetical protein
MEKICEQCGDIFIINEKIKRSREKRFCCLKCAAINNGLKNKGRQFSEEVNKSKGLSGESNPMFGKTHSDELKKQIIKTKLETNLKNVKNCNLTNIEKEVLDGIMISDGCLTSTTAISARLSLGFKYNETLEDIKTALSSIIFGPTNVVNNGKSFHNKSKMYGDLLLENKRWYVNGKKIIPNDIKITKNLCYWWFIGDGYNSNENVYLCTDSFTKEENLLLCSKFNELEFKCNLTSKNRIRFYKKDSIEFLKWITPENGIHQQYKYKWKIK